jgi:hypothetical protein
MTLRARVTKHIQLGAGLVRFAAFIATHPDLPIEKAEQTFSIGPGAFAERKREADLIAKSYNARTQWRNGYYMAEFAKGGLVHEIHFAPMICEQNTGDDA